MKKVYFDSSAFVKVFAQESGSQEASLLFQLALDGRVRIYMSTWAINETIAAIDRMHRRRTIAEQERNRIAATIIGYAIKYSEEQSAIKFVPVIEELVSKSKDVLMAYHLSADDALHLYTAFAKDCEHFIHKDDKLKKNTGGKIDELVLLDVADNAEINPLLKQL